MTGTDIQVGAVVLLLSVPKWLQARIHWGYCHLRPGMYGIIKGTTFDGKKYAVEFFHKIWSAKSNGDRSSYDNGCRGLCKGGYSAYIGMNDVAFVREETPEGAEWGDQITSSTLGAYILKGMTGYDYDLGEAVELGDFKWAINPDHQAEYRLPGANDMYAVTDKNISSHFQNWCNSDNYRYYVDNTEPHVKKSVSWDDVKRVAEGKAVTNLQQLKEFKQKAAPKRIVYDMTPILGKDGYPPQSVRDSVIDDNLLLLLP